MISDDVLRSVAFVKRGKNRRKVLEAVEQPGLPSEIVVAIYGKSSESFFATVSRALSELEEKNIIELLNPEERTGRTYRLTPLGKAVLSYLHRERSRKEIISR